MKKKGLMLICCMVLFNAGALRIDAKEINDPNVVIMTHEDVKMKDAFISSKKMKVKGTKAVKVTYDPKSGIDWDKGYRTVWGSCQAKQGSINLDSYSRARFEKFGSPYLDSGRVWSTNQGRSFARSGSELYDSLNSGVAHTYYGIGVD